MGDGLCFVSCVCLFALGRRLETRRLFWADVLLCSAPFVAACTDAPPPFFSSTVVLPALFQQIISLVTSLLYPFYLSLALLPFESKNGLCPVYWC